VGCVIGQLIGRHGLVDCYLCSGPVMLDPRERQRTELIGLVPPGPALCCKCLVDHAGWNHEQVAYELGRKEA